MNLTTQPRRVVVTGAGGFIGAALSRRLVADPAWRADRFIFCDLKLADTIKDDRVERIEGDFGDLEVRERLTHPAPDIIFHLGGVLGGAAEADYALARRVNIDATLSLLEALSSSPVPPRVVFASSIAVFGPTSAAAIDDETGAYPVLNYGAQKRMVEVAIEQLSVRGWIEGLALRLPGVVARPNPTAGLKSAFLNALFHDYAAGRDVELPVSPEGTTWLLSASACVEALLHAATLPSRALDHRRAMTLPAQRVAFEDLVAGLERRFPESRSRVTFAPDADIEAQFGRQPILSTPLADSLGFRHDGDLDRLIVSALQLETRP